jgi:HNH endonuclease
MQLSTTNPVAFRLDTLLALGVSEVHELACKAVGTLTSYRVVLGRCLLAMRESKGFKKFGCSSEMHYAISHLGLSEGVAGECRRVARDLIRLPELTLAAEFGTIEWSKLREITRKASPKTEAFWLELSKKLNYKPIEKLVRKTPKGALPGDVFAEEERVTSELRCEVSEEVLAMLDRARRLYSLEQDRAVTTAQVLEFALASYIANQPVDQEGLEKIRQDMDRDLQAQKAREIPLVAAAREVAAEMGFIPVPAAEDSEEPLTRAGENSGLEDMLQDAVGGFPCLPVQECCHAQIPRTGETSDPEETSTTALADTPCRSTLESRQDQLPRTGENPLPVKNRTKASYELVKTTRQHNLNTGLPPIQNKRICFNPLNRHATRAQKREILQRQVWCCSTPGCPHKLWLHLHHLIPYSQGGPTHDRNLLGLCVACHTNVHDGSLRIFQTQDGKLHFTDAEGNSLAKQADLELAGWLDRYQGWEGGEEDSYSLRARCGDWAVFDRYTKTRLALNS